MIDFTLPARQAIYAISKNTVRDIRRVLNHQQHGGHRAN